MTTLNEIDHSLDRERIERHSCQICGIQTEVCTENVIIDSRLLLLGTFQRENVIVIRVCTVYFVLNAICDYIAYINFLLIIYKMYLMKVK